MSVRVTTYGTSRYLGILVSLGLVLTSGPNNPFVQLYNRYNVTILVTVDST